MPQQGAAAAQRFLKRWVKYTANKFQRDFDLFNVNRWPNRSTCLNALVLFTFASSTSKSLASLFASCLFISWWIYMRTWTSFIRCARSHYHNIYLLILVSLVSYEWDEWSPISWKIPIEPAVPVWVRICRSAIGRLAFIRKWLKFGLTFLTCRHNRSQVHRSKCTLS